MKRKLITLLTLLTLFTVATYAQELEENKIDEFTNIKVKRTSWETLNNTMEFTAYFRISRLNDIDYFDLKMMNAGIFSIGKGQELMFKLSNGEIVKLQNIEYAITCTGCGAIGFGGSAGQGIQVSYLIDKENFEKLKSNSVVKIRIYTNSGYVENDTKEKNAKKIKSALPLVE
jgi:hypothetical protein